MNEEWRDIPEYESYYQISNRGRLRGLDRRDKLGRIWPGKILRVHRTANGYLRVELNREGQSRKWPVHRLVALAFHGVPGGDVVINHINGNKTDNRPENLEWTTQKENDRHSREILGNHGRGESNGHAKVTEHQVREIREKRPYFTLHELGEQYDVSYSTIWAACMGQNWAWLD